MTLLFVMLIKLIYARSNKGNIHKKVSQDINYMNKRKTFQINIICIYNSTMICNIHDYIKGRSWWLLCKIYSSYFSRIRLSCIENKTRLELQRRCKLTTVNVQRIMEFLLFTFPNLHSTSSFMTSHLSASICVPSSKSPHNPITPQASIVCCRKRVFWMGENEICTHLGVFSRE